jgi:hypothetical protein
VALLRLARPVTTTSLKLGCASLRL